MALPQLPQLPALNSFQTLAPAPRTKNYAALFIENPNPGPDIGGGDYGGGGFGGGIGGFPGNPFDPTGVTGDFGCDPIFGCPGTIGYGVNPIIGVSDGSGGGSGGGGIITVGNTPGRGQATQVSNGILSWFDWSRWAAFLLGLILVAGGLYLLKPVQQIVTAGVRAAKDGAEALA